MPFLALDFKTNDKLLLADKYDKLSPCLILIDNKGDIIHPFAA